ncbi:hypothetical protein [Dyella japonica]|uniref:Uncharacterized protein n=1 Tax=Dyella japonica A8 TaxID=1217721 RepID=A0A075K239_9GAMM|nr:hypothetical protein [Dyella japonica]AIF48299.1 hypothetical protein HY57_14120 [Dyella japonica A8]
MPSRPTSLLQRLRRHRGLWVLVVAVMFIKLLSGTVCLADGGERDSLAGGSQAVVAMTMEAAAPATGDGDCVLGEGASCHCACSHSLALPTMVVLAIGAPATSFATSSVDAGRVPDAAGSLLRPPIA